MSFASISASDVLPDVPVVPSGSSRTMYIANLGSSAGACPINEITHLRSALGIFCAVPVFPAIECPSIYALCAVPNSTVFSRYFLRYFDVEAVTVCLTRTGEFSLTTSPFADSIFLTICG